MADKRPVRPDAGAGRETARIPSQVDPRAVQPGLTGAWGTIGRQHLGRYLRLPNYTNNLRRLGFGNDDLADGGSDRLVDAIVAGGLDRIAARVDEHLEAGADHVCLQVLAEDPSVMPRAAWRQLAALVGPAG